MSARVPARVCTCGEVSAKGWGQGPRGGREVTREPGRSCAPPRSPGPRRLARVQAAPRRARPGATGLQAPDPALRPPVPRGPQRGPAMARG